MEELVTVDVSDVFERPGRFSLTDEVIKEAPEVIMSICGQVLITRAEASWARKSIEYEGFSPFFEKVEPGVVMPEYDIEAAQDDNGVISFTWVKKS